MYYSKLFTLFLCIISLSNNASAQRFIQGRNTTYKGVNYHVDFSRIYKKPNGEVHEIARLRFINNDIYIVSLRYIITLEGAHIIHEKKYETEDAFFDLWLALITFPFVLPLYPIVQCVKFYQTGTLLAIHPFSHFNTWKNVYADTITRFRLTGLLGKFL